VSPDVWALAGTARAGLRWCGAEGPGACLGEARQSNASLRCKLLRRPVLPLLLWNLTLPPKNVSLAECFNASKENGHDEDDESALHAGVQEGGRAAGR